MKNTKKVWFEIASPSVEVLSMNAIVVRFGLIILTVVLFLTWNAAAATDTTTFRNLAKGTSSGINEPKQELIKKQADWEKFWTKHTALMTPTE
ncbi:MAG: hypothetical protein FJ403_11775 [Verrucomicrobia bacterium]|nr:hypothetical protein [Verrucomicrobiota bacterium]